MRPKALVLLVAAILAPASDAPRLEIWHGNVQRVGHLGDAQDDFNLMGRVDPWQEVDTLEWRLAPRRNGTPLSFRAFRRLAKDGDFNADIPIGMLQPGENKVSIIAKFRDGRTLERPVVVRKETGSRPLPVRIEWSKVKDPQDVGQYVDGMWRLTHQGLRTARIGYDRVFLIGERDWKDYEVRTSVTIHHVASETTPISGPNGVGVILRFAGHVAGGPRHFPSGQPKWGYQPFGAIGWLRWARDAEKRSPVVQFYRGDNDRSTNFAHVPVSNGQQFRIRFRCETLPEDSADMGVTKYSFRVWPANEPEPDTWSYEQVQRSESALRRGGVALLAHHVDATFGDIEVSPVP